MNAQEDNSRTQLEKEIRSMVARIVKLPEEKVGLEANLFTELRVDSLLGVEIFASLDKKYGIEVPEEKLKNIKTVRDLVDLIQSIKK